VLELLTGIIPYAKHSEFPFEIDIYIDGKIFPLSEVKENILANKQIYSKNNYFDLRLYLSLNKNLINTFKKSSPPVIFYLLKGKYITLKDKIWNKIRKASIRYARNKIGSYDLIHLTMPCYFKTLTSDKPKFLTTVHDLTHLYFPDFHTSKNIISTEKGLKYSIRKKSHFITVSNSTRNDLLKEYKIDAQKVKVIYEAADNSTFRRLYQEDCAKIIKRKYNLPPTPYFLSLCTLEPRKNIINTIRAFLLLEKENPDLEINLVIAGRKGWKIEDLFQDQSIKSNKIIFSGFIEEQDLSTIYNSAIALLYASYYEGFGLPPLESMSCGTPVIYGNNSSLKEIIGEAGLACQPDDIYDIKEKMKLLIDDKQLREDKSKLSMQRASDFSWEKSVRETLNYYQEILENN
ncbi:MAG: glycosyltransferase family 4 protein, partial [Cytophagaceae bacterium]